MALCKLGMNNINGVMYPVYLVSGNAVRDGEAPPAGSKRPAKVTVAATTKEDGETVFIAINGWRDRAEDIMAVRKGDSILCIGPMKSREYNGKTYVDIDAEFICRSSIDGGAVVTGQYTNAPIATQIDFADLSEEEGEDDLPF